MGQQIKYQLFTNMLIRVQVTAANASDSQTVDEFLPAHSFLLAYYPKDTSW